MPNALITCIQNVRDDFLILVFLAHVKRVQYGTDVKQKKRGSGR